MCFKFILSLFSKPVPGSPAPEPFPPYPEEKQDTARTVANTNVREVLEQWANERHIPMLQWDFWFNQIYIQIYDTWPIEIIVRFGIHPDTPAFAYESQGKRYLCSLASWLNSGVIQHEQCHNSFSLLTDEQRAEFTALYEQHKELDPELVKLWVYNRYGLTNATEGHAEIGRYLWEKMPEWAKSYYPGMI